jgi:hypothetical protein
MPPQTFPLIRRHVARIELLTTTLNHVNPPSQLDLELVDLLRAHDQHMAALALCRTSPWPCPAQSAPLTPRPPCPRCGNNRQVWRNQITGRLTCHRSGCQTEIIDPKETP